MCKSFQIAILFVGVTAILSSQETTIFVSGLQFPQRLIMTSGGSLIASEGGTPEPNTGRVSIVDKSGTRRSLLEGLPTGLAHFTFPFGPTGMVLDGRTLYLLIGEGDIMRGMPPNYGINLDGPSSPIFSSLLKIEFPQIPDAIQNSFRFEPADHWALLDGYDVTLRNSSGDGATVRLLTAFRPMVRNILGGTERVRPYDPYGIALSSDKRTLYVADASAETISRVDADSGRAQVIVRLLPFTRATPAPTSVDNVPTSVCLLGNRLMIGLLSAGPFPAGEASIQALDPVAGTLSPFSAGFTAVSERAATVHRRS